MQWKGTGISVFIVGVVILILVLFEVLGYWRFRGRIRPGFLNNDQYMRFVALRSRYQGGHDIPFYFPRDGEDEFTAWLNSDSVGAKEAREHVQHGAPLESSLQNARGTSTPAQNSSLECNRNQALQLQVDNDAASSVV